MKKLIKSLFVTAFAVSSIIATTTNKTFLLPRSQGVNLAMEYATYNELIQHTNGDFFGANFQIIPFYMESSDKNNISKYFSIKGRNNIRLANAAAIIGDTADFEYQYMIHDYNNGNGVGKVKYKPKLEAYGARIDYYQNLKKFFDGLYLKIALPIVHVENDMRINTEVSTDGTTFTSPNLSNYFKGSYTANINTTNAQEALSHAKINGSKSETSIADIDIILGYKIFDEHKYYVIMNLGLTIPTGNDPDGHWVFEPIVGNGNHWGFGGGLDLSVKLWEKNNQNIKLTVAANYRFLFESSQRRTLGLKDMVGTQIDWGQYYLAGKIGVAINAQQLTPVANLLTQKVNVEPGGQFDSIIYFSYNNGGLTIDLGYNFFWKEIEKVSTKNIWPDKKYGIARITQDMSIVPDGAGAGDNGIFHVTNAIGNTDIAGGSIGYINKAPNNAILPAATINLAAPTATTAYGIDTSVAEIPSQDTHKIYGALGYILKDCKYPVMLGFGGGYEFIGDGIENWQIFGKLGVKF